MCPNEPSNTNIYTVGPSLHKMFFYSDITPDVV